MSCASLIRLSFIVVGIWMRAYAVNDDRSKESNAFNGTKYELPRSSTSPKLERMRCILWREKFKWNTLSMTGFQKERAE